MGNRLKIDNTVCEAQSGKLEGKSSRIDTEVYGEIQGRQVKQKKQSSIDLPVKSALLTKIKVNPNDPIARKWQEVRQDPALLESDYEAAKFLVQSRLIYSIVGFQNSTKDGAQKNAIRLNSAGKMTIKKNGIWTPVSQFAEKLEIDGRYNLLTDKRSRSKGWNYLSTTGLTQIDRFCFNDLVPVEQLSQEETKKLAAHAQQFEFGSKAAPDSSRNCVVQIVMNPRSMTSYDNNFLLKNLAAHQPVHASLRVITKDGKVYSPGFGSEEKEDKERKKFLNTLASNNGVPTILDFEEFRKHEGRMVTSIPVTEKDCEKILGRLNEYRHDTLRFNIMNQNCTKLVADIIELAGVKIDNRMSMRKLIISILPDAKDIPVIGPMVHKVRTAAGKAFKAIAVKTPDAIKKPLIITKHVVGYIPDKLINFSLNLGLKVLGASASTKQPSCAEKLDAKYQAENSSMRQFKSILPGWKSLFGDEALYMYHSLPMMQWMLKQSTTIVHPYAKDGKPGMNILPPETSSQLQACGIAKNHWKRRLITVD